MIALTHAPLGIEVVRRGIIFIDLAIAQIAALGIVIANITFHKFLLLNQLILLNREKMILNLLVVYQ